MPANRLMAHSPGCSLTVLRVRVLFAHRLVSHSPSCAKLGSCRRNCGTIHTEGLIVMQEIASVFLLRLVQARALVAYLVLFNSCDFETLLGVKSLTDAIQFPVCGRGFVRVLQFLDVSSPAVCVSCLVGALRSELKVCVCAHCFL